MEAVERPCGAGEFALHRASDSGALDFSALGRSGRSAHFRIHFWRPPRPACSPGVPGHELAARRIYRCDDGLGNHGGYHWSRGRYAARPDGYASLLWLQHGRLFRALARKGEEYPPPAEDFPRELVPQRRRRKIPVAWLWRKCPRPEVDARTD